MIKITYTVERIIFQKGNFAIATVKIKDNGGVIPPTSEAVVKGEFMSIFVKNTFESTGEWKLPNNQGWQFHAETSILKFAASDKALVQFLTESVKGLGISTAKRLVTEFREDTTYIIKEHPERMLEVKGITEKKMNAIHQTVMNQVNLDYTITTLTQYGLTYAEAFKLFSLHDRFACYLLEQNPYQLSSVKNVSFKSLDTAALKLNIPKDDKRRVTQGIIEWLKEGAATRGNLYEFRNGMYFNIPRMLMRKGVYPEQITITEDQLDSILKEMVLNNKVIVKKYSSVYLPYYAKIEDKIISSILKKRGDNEEVHSLDNQIEMLLTGMSLDRTQKSSVMMAIQNPISIMTGGPGTGKTATIRAIIEILQLFKPECEVMLMAPTGKAAKRMQESTGVKATTIHRAIGLNTLEDEESQLKEIDCELLIIDESSMIDAPLFETLLSVITPNTKLLIVGDAEQLPSVGPGLILRDLINSGFIPSRRLTTIYRQETGSQIITNAYKAIKGDENLELGKEFFFNEVQNKASIKETILNTIQVLMNNDFALDEIQVLSVMNKGDLGVIELNRAIQDRFNGTGTGKFRVGDKVIHTINNYELEVFNGESGKVIEMLSNGNLIVDFEDRKVEYLPENIMELSLGYAITVHKAQGSEFPVVIMPFNASLTAMLNRNIIYTGITRASERVVLIGDREAFNNGLQTVENMKRNSNIMETLWRVVEAKRHENDGDNEDIPF